MLHAVAAVQLFHQNTVLLICGVAATSSYRNLFNKSNILRVSCQYIFLINGVCNR